MLGGLRGLKRKHEWSGKRFGWSSGLRGSGRLCYLVGFGDLGNRYLDGGIFSLIVVTGGIFNNSFPSTLPELRT